MKYYEVFKGGMPGSLYKMSEEERLKQNFNIKDGIIETLEPDKPDKDEIYELIREKRALEMEKAIIMLKYETGKLKPPLWYKIVMIMESPASLFGVCALATAFAGGFLVGYISGVY